MNSNMLCCHVTCCWLTLLSCMRFGRKIRLILQCMSAQTGLTALSSSFMDSLAAMRVSSYFRATGGTRTRRLEFFSDGVTAPVP